MNVFKLRRGLAATLVITASALIAVGCGGSGGSGAADAAKNAKGLDFVPADAVAYLTFDTDFQGDNWKNVDALAPAFFKDVKSVDEYIEESTEDSDSKVDWTKDVEPWLGDTAGFAITGVPKGESDPEMLGWVDIKDKAEFEKFAKGQDMEKTGSSGDFDLWIDEDDADEPKGERSYLAVSDDLLLFADGEAFIKTMIKADGDSIKDADGIGDVVDNVGGDALVALVVNGDGVRKAMLDSGDEDAAKAAKNKEIQKIDGLSLSLAVEDEGFHVHGFVGTDGLDKALLGTNGSTDLINDLPADTLMAVGGNDLGGSIKSGLDLAGDTDGDFGDAIGTFEGILGVSVADLAKAFAEEWAFSIGGSDEAIQGVVGGAVGAAMMGSAEGYDPSSLSDVTATLSFATSDSTGDTMEKLFGATQLATGTPPKAGTSGGFETLTAMVSGVPITAATSDDVALITTNAAGIETWGSGDTLADNDSFTDAWKAADAPDEVSGIMFLDWPRISKIAQIPTSDKATAGGWVAWSEADGDDASFDLFMQVDAE